MATTRTWITRNRSAAFLRVGCNSLAVLVILFCGGVPSADALTPDELQTLTASVKEMCETPTDSGERFKVEGAASGGVIVRALGANLEGEISRETWQGIEQIRETQSDRLKCVTEVLYILAPRMESRSTPSASAVTVRDSFTMNGGMTREITDDGLLLSMLGTPFRARGDLVGISLEGKTSALGVGGKVDLAYSGGSCSLFVTEIIRGENEAVFALRCP